MVLGFGDEVFWAWVVRCWGEGFEILGCFGALDLSGYHVANPEP